MCLNCIYIFYYNRVYMHNIFMYNKYYHVYYAYKQNILYLQKKLFSLLQVNYYLHDQTIS